MIEAETTYREILQKYPRDFDLLHQLGIVLGQQGNFTAAAAFVEHLSLCLLRAGDFLRGWEEHEWRWRTPKYRDLQPDVQAQSWLGSKPLEGKTILLHCEQGFGDTLQFCRYAKPVALLGATVTLEVQPPLLPLLENLDGTGYCKGNSTAIV